MSSGCSTRTPSSYSSCSSAYSQSQSCLWSDATRSVFASSPSGLSTSNFHLLFQHFKFESTIREGIRNAIDNYPDGDLKKSIDLLQEHVLIAVAGDAGRMELNWICLFKIQCCGLSNYTDWFTSKWANGTNKVPVSCCKANLAERCKHEDLNGDASDIYEEVRIRISSSCFVIPKLLCALQRAATESWAPQSIKSTCWLLALVSAHLSSFSSARCWHARSRITSNETATNRSNKSNMHLFKLLVQLIAHYLSCDSTLKCCFFSDFWKLCMFFKKSNKRIYSIFFRSFFNKIFKIQVVNHFSSIFC